MSISTFNFQFYNYKLPAAVPVIEATSFSELEMDIDEEEMTTAVAVAPITSTPLPAKQHLQHLPRPPTPRFTSELALPITGPEANAVATPKPIAKPLPELRPQLYKSQKRWSMELREKVLEMSKRNNGSDEHIPQFTLQQQRQEQQDCNATFTSSSHIADDDDVVAAGHDETTRSVSDKINFFNKLTNTFESARSTAQNTNNNNNNNANRFISLLRSSRPMGVATTGNGNGNIGLVPPPKPKRLAATTSATATSVPDVASYQFATPNAKPPTAYGNNGVQRKCSLRRKPSMEKSRATISRQNSNAATLRPQRHAMMEDLSLVVPVRLRIAEYEQRISMGA
ncbi:protein bottleneck [Drosophila sulfurigaster albostrigata]|uniref:protein bottleneck n=1 Tax=Drosophila sulfurigaster albostrigata TaxID=89887 RepID=UPI002D21B9A0|nr:protein bottleneck [Drosophila sulfurigaster albostrigata]